MITSTDTLIEEVNTAGVTIKEEVDGYSWHVNGTELAGKRTTAVAAVATAIHQMRCMLEAIQRDMMLLAQRDHIAANSP